MENVVYNTSSNKDKFVINDAEITRITDNTNPEYQYHLKDHLGNVRLTFTSKTSSDIYTATLENNTQAVESATFRNYSRNNFDLFDHTDAGATYTYSQLLNGGNGQQIGLAKTFSVMPGDTIKAEVYAKYRNLSSTASNLSGFALALTSAFGLSSGMTGDAAAAYNALNSYGAAIAGGSNHSEDINAPKAYLNILLFDKDYNLVDAAYKQIGINDTQTDPVVKAPHGYLYREKVVAEAGYAFVFLSNEHPTQVDVYFDDLKVTFAKSRVVQMDDYYPFGLTFNHFARENNVSQNYKFNGKEEQKDLDLAWLDFGARMYMSEIGRWGVVDPLTELCDSWSPFAFGYNNPVRFIDPTGMENEDSADDGKKKQGPNSRDPHPGENESLPDFESDDPTPQNTNSDNDTGSSTTGNGAAGPVGGFGDIVEKSAQVGDDDGPGIPLGMWVDPSSVKLKKIGDAWYGSAHIDEDIVVLKLPNGIARVHLNTTVNFNFSARLNYRKKELSQYFVALAIDRARMAVGDELYANPSLSSATAARDFKEVFQIHLTDLTFGAEVKSYAFPGTRTFEVKFQLLPSFSPK
jgi:RHS repeat-associated protein